jgi:hypothetical protein
MALRREEVLQTRHKHALRISTSYFSRKVKLTLWRAMKARRGSTLEAELYSSFNLGGGWSGWLTPYPGRFTPENDPAPTPN